MAGRPPIIIAGQLRKTFDLIMDEFGQIQSSNVVVGHDNIAIGLPLGFPFEPFHADLEIGKVCQTLEKQAGT